MKHLYKTLWAIVILAIGVAPLWVFQPLSSESQATLPEAGSREERTAVAVEPIEFYSLRLHVSSQGFVEPRYQTDITSQVQGTLAYFSPNFLRGGFVTKGEVLVKLDDKDYRSFLVEAEAELAKIRADLELEQARGQAAKEEWRNINEKPPNGLALRRPQRRHQKARLKAAQAAFDRAQNKLERTTIRAPYDGLVTARTQGLGAYVSAASVLGTVMSTEVAEIRLPLADGDAK